MKRLVIGLIIMLFLSGCGLVGIQIPFPQPTQENQAPVESIENKIQANYDDAKAAANQIQIGTSIDKVTSLFKNQRVDVQTITTGEGIEQILDYSIYCYTCGGGDHTHYVYYINNNVVTKIYTYQSGS